MLEFLQENWFWLLLAVGALWFFSRRGRGAGEHGSHGADSQTTPATGDTAHVQHGQRRRERLRARRGC